MGRTYVPDANEWERRDPEAVGIDPEAVTRAVNYTEDSDGTDARREQDAFYLKLLDGIE
ncbi:hypothetical protein U4E84_16910 [Halorubrum sp. AD140]|uniref:hypothetical protein n=1 Tax=Halorubrum sp. AD140 TaxID=3050073 RepID=UPI002ACD1E4A|nr:hypothetical protein [Halorubrum sp. AD140]MDZ5813019.1 hypothetical protein [Halorubrum sp. AD140]